MRIVNNKGITLIALVITIVVLIILAGVSINILLGENGIITKASTTKETQKIAEITEKLELEKAPVGADNLGNVSLDNYLNQIKTNKIIEAKDVKPIIDGVEITDDCYIIIEDKYKYLLEEEESGNLKITYQGIPLILNIETEIKTNGIKVKTIIEDKYKDKEKYRFYIKTNKTGEYDKKAEQEENGEYTFERLTQGLTYYIKVEVETKEGIIDSKQIAIKTGEIPGINTGDIIFNTTPEGWTKENKKTTISSKVEGYELQYQKNATSESIKDESKWTKYEGAIISEKNESIYVRLWDGTNAGSTYAIQNVIGIDKIVPNNFTIASSSVTTKSFVVSGSATDGAATSEYGSSGIKNYTYYFKKSTDTNYTSAIQTGTSKTYSNLSAGTYNVYVVATDNAENIKQSNTINVTLGNVTDLVSGNVTFKSTPTGWTKGDISTTISTSVTGFTLQYSLDAKTWTNYTNPITNTKNGSIYARLTDGVNSGNYTVQNITTIDKIVPNNFTIASSSVTTKSFVVSGSATDGAATSEYGSSGIKNYTYYFKKSTDTNYTSAIQTGTSKTYSNLSAGTYNVYVVATDNAGNAKQSNTINVTLGNVTDLVSGNVTFVTSPSGWTKTDVNTTINTSVTGFTLQYSLDAKTWTNYTKPITNTKNGSIYARLTDGVNSGNYAVQNITTIDKIVPNNFTIASSSVTTKSFVVSGSTTDGVATSEYGSSGIKNYTYYFKKSTDANYTSAVQTGTSKTYSNLSARTYNVYVVATDNAGNAKQSNTINVTLGTVSGITGATFTPTGWTNGNVTITLPTKSGYTTQYQINSASGTWTNYTKAFAISTNSTIYYRYNDGINAGSYAALNITNIDKTAPSKTTVNLNGYVSGSTTSSNVTQTASATDNVKVAYYQYSHDGVNVVGTFPNPWTINYDGQWNFYVRAVDHVGNIGAWSNKYTIIRISTVPLINKAKPGDYVKYKPRIVSYVSPSNLNGHSNQTFNTSSYTGLWQVIYNDSAKGLQITSAGSVGNITIYGKAGYNNIVTTLNKISEQYMDGKYAIAARHVGTDPNNPAGPTTMVNVNGQNVITWDRTSHISDIHAMNAAKSQIPGGITQMGFEYFICSRQKYTVDGSVNLAIADSRNPGDNNPSDRVPLLVHSNGTISQIAITEGVRPVIKLNSNTPVIGTGTASDPYVIR